MSKVTSPAYDSHIVSILKLEWIKPFVLPPLLMGSIKWVKLL